MKVSHELRETTRKKCKYYFMLLCPFDKISCCLQLIIKNILHFSYLKKKEKEKKKNADENINSSLDLNHIAINIETHNRYRNISLIFC